MLFNTLCSELGDKMAFGGKLTVIGIAIVFILLGLLVIILEVMQKVNDNLAKRPPREKKSLKDFFKKNKEPENAVIEEITPENIVVTDEVKEECDDSTIAAIMGALSVILSDENDNSTFVVKKIKKLNFRR